jgi:cell division topological specificity factor
MALFDFIQRLLGLQKPSATTAKERLQLVLAHDRSDLNPELLEQMRREILEVVQKYVEIDLESGDVSLVTEDRVTALMATLPIRRAKARPPARPADHPLPAAPATETPTDGQPSPSVLPSPPPADPPPGESPSADPPPPNEPAGESAGADI